MRYLVVISLLLSIVCPVFSQEMVTAKKDSLRIAIVARANSYYNKNEFKQAIILYRKAARMGGKQPAIAFNIGNSFFQAGDLPSAAASYRRAIEGSDGKLIDALFNLAAVQYRLGNYGESIAVYRRALKSESSNTSAWLYLAEAYEKTGDIIGAQHALEQALSAVPDDISIVYQLAETHVALKEIDNAISIVRKAYQLNPSETDFLFYIADLYVLQNDVAMALSTFREAFSVDPDNYNGHYRMADLLVQDNQQFLAMDHLLKAIAIKPSFTDAHLFLGNIAFDLKWWDRALGAYKKALSLGETESVVGIMNVVYELAQRKDFLKARDAAAVLRTVNIKDPVKRREWEEIELLLR